MTFTYIIRNFSSVLSIVQLTVHFFPDCTCYFTAECIFTSRIFSLINKSHVGRSVNQQIILMSVATFGISESSNAPSTSEFLLPWRLTIYKHTNLDVGRQFVHADNVSSNLKSSVHVYCSFTKYCCCYLKLGSL